MPFQSTVNQYPAPGLEGGWASVNEHFSMLIPTTGDPALANFIAWRVGPAGQVVARFGFAAPDGSVQNVHPGVANVQIGWVHRYQPVINPGWLQQSGALMYPGQEVDIVDSMDTWMRFAAGATLGQKVFASYTDGSAIAGTAGTPPTATGVTASTTNGSPNLTAVAGGTLSPGQPISGTGIPAGTYIVSTSGATAVMSANATATGTGVALTQTTAIETRWYVKSVAAAGELARCATRS